MKHLLDRAPFDGRQVWRSPGRRARRAPQREMAAVMSPP